MPRVRRRWVVLGIVVVLGLVAIRLLFQPLPLESYRVLDPQTVVVSGLGAPGEWTRLSDVIETDSSVTITVDGFTFQPPLPGTSVGARLMIGVGLETPLGNRIVIDGGTGQPIPESSN